MAQPTNQEIPLGLDDKSKQIYEKILGVRSQRLNKNEVPPNLVVITDIGKDLDDLLAMKVLAPLQLLGLINIKGFITNLEPAQKRARFARGALDSLGLSEIPVAWGEAATVKPAPEYPYEFQCGFMAENVIFTPYNQPKKDPGNPREIESGISFLNRIVRDIVEMSDGQPREPRQEEKLTFLLISSLSDIWTFVRSQPENFVKATDRVILQGRYEVDINSPNCSQTLIADPFANNNAYDIDSANNFHEFIGRREVPSVVFTSVSAVASALNPEILENMAASGHVLGRFALDVHTKLNLKYYDDACSIDRRFRDHMDQKWFLDNRTNWFLSHFGHEAYLIGPEVVEYIQIMAYDALGALEAGGTDVRHALKLLKPSISPSIHQVIGKRAPDTETGDPGDTGVNIREMKMALIALWKGSLFG